MSAVGQRVDLGGGAPYEDTSAGAAPPMARSASHELTDALILIVMTFACTGLAIYDLLLLATGL